MLLDLAAVQAATFANFTADAGQHEALRAVQDVAAGGAGAYLWGAAGTGKSHLLQACAHGAPDAAQLHVCDDVSALDAAGQRRLFVALEQAAQHDAARVVAADRRPPAQLAQLAPEVRSRLQALPCLRLLPLSDRGRQAALLGYAARCGRALDAAVAQALVENLPRDMTCLVRAFRQLDEHAIATDTKLTGAAANAWLRARATG